MNEHLYINKVYISVLYLLHNMFNQFIMIGVKTTNQNVYNILRVVVIKKRNCYIAVGSGFTTVR